MAITLLKTFRLNSPDGPVKNYLGCGDVTEKNSIRILFRIKGRWLTVGACLYMRRDKVGVWF